MYSILGLTPLHLAVQDGNKKLAKMLLDCGADINAVVSKDNLPHHLSPQILPSSASCAYYGHYFFSVVSSFWVYSLYEMPPLYQYRYLEDHDPIHM